MDYYLLLFLSTLWSHDDSFSYGLTRTASVYLWTAIYFLIFCQTWTRKLQIALWDCIDFLICVAGERVWQHLSSSRYLGHLTCFQDHVGVIILHLYTCCTVHVCLWMCVHVWEGGDVSLALSLNLLNLKMIKINLLFSLNTSVVRIWFVAYRQTLKLILLFSSKHTRKKYSLTWLFMSLQLLP